MLPGSRVRHRNSAASVTEGMERLSSVMNDSARRYRRLPLAGKIVFCLSLLFSFLMYGLIFRHFMKHDVTHDNFLDVPKCPACFGSSGCGLIYYDQIQLTGWSNYRFTDVFNSKNIRYATMSSSQKVVLKKMATDLELAELDSKVCKSANRPDGCDVARVLFLTDVAVAMRKEPLQPKHLAQTVGMFTCASYRLLDRMWTRYKEVRKQKKILVGDKLQLWYTASLNPEPLLLQTFPAAERWPFPEYFGACGRQIIVEHVGRTLEQFYHEPFHKRAALALELLKIAEQLTNNDEDYALYITDPSWSNFGVDAAGKVRILDAENIIVVDKQAIDAKKPPEYERFLQSEHSLCTDGDCLAMMPHRLCSRLHSDHNYYAVCNRLLDPALEDSLMPGGLLHDMPEEARDFWDLEHLLKECSLPSKYKGRIFAKDKLITALNRLQDKSMEHLEPPPKINPAGVRKLKPKKELWEYADYDDGEEEKGGGDKSGGEDVERVLDKKGVVLE
ncbi:divergent protein kinase domain 2A-like [Babylonia areolata]|uniref:divergent protein kinase domain 2A-like n=1 Tax=Babylonia areolata TaxID=304850 RepID=UPI003FD5F089